jgi:hypothetical protein
VELRVKLRVVLVVLLAGCRFDAPAGGGGPDAAIDAAIDAAPPTSCTPNKTQCFGNALETCNAAGSGFDPAKQVVCPLTCSQGACVAASNISEADQRSCGPTAPALAPPTGATIVLALGQITCAPSCGGGITTIARRGTTPNDWYCLSSVTLPSNLTINVVGAQSAITWLVHGAVTIDKAIDLGGGDATGDLAPGGDLPGAGGPGGFAGGALATNDQDGKPGMGPCGGAEGEIAETGNNAAGGGGAGAGYSSAGARGGNGRSNNNTQADGGAGGGATCDHSDARPLVGGSGGGGGGDGGCGGAQCGWPGGGGGGGLHIASRVQITVNATLDASGGNGFGENTQAAGGGGGGAGGTLLLEAPILSGMGQLRVDGGTGGTSKAGPGGAGASGATGPAPGSDAAMTSRGAGGGGGAGGRVRLNAASGASCNPASPNASCSTGALRATP